VRGIESGAEAAALCEHDPAAATSTVVVYGSRRRQLEDD
jgi:hypothetical protein